MCQQILNADRFDRTFLRTQRTSDTAGLAYLHHLRTLILIHTVDRIFCLIRYHLYKVLGTCFNTFTTGLAFILINHRNAVYHAYRTELTHIRTGSETYTSEIAALRTEGTKLAILQSITPL